MSQEFLKILALATLGVSSVGFITGVFWAIPTAKRDLDSVDPEDLGMVVFAKHLLFVACLSTFSLLCFIVTAGLIIAFDMDAPPRVLGARLLIFAVLVALSTMVVAGPIARKRANRGEATRMRVEQRTREERKQIQAAATETNERLRAIQEQATGVRERLEEHDAQSDARRDKSDVVDDEDLRISRGLRDSDEERKRDARKDES